MSISERLYRRFTERTPGVGRVFLQCGATKAPGCGRVVPYYRAYGPKASVGCPHCGRLFYSPTNIPEWRAALWLAWGWLSGNGDPRMPIRTEASRYA